MISGLRNQERRTKFDGPQSPTQCCEQTNISTWLVAGLGDSWNCSCAGAVVLLLGCASDREGDGSAAALLVERRRLLRARIDLMIVRILFSLRVYI